MTWAGDPRDPTPVAKPQQTAGSAEGAFVVHPLEDWHEDDGDVLWWRLPIREPPFVSTPLSSDWRLEAKNGRCITADDVGDGGDGGYAPADIKGPWATHWSRFQHPQHSDEILVRPARWLGGAE